jgi:hypothetical protein
MGRGDKENVDVFYGWSPMEVNTTQLQPKRGVISLSHSIVNFAIFACGQRRQADYYYCRYELMVK